MTWNADNTAGALAVFIIVGALAAVIFGGGLVVWALWNWLAPVFGSGIRLTYWQGVGVSLALTVIGGYFKRSTK